MPSRSSCLHANGLYGSKFGGFSDLEKGPHDVDDDLFLGNAGGLSLSPCQEEMTEEKKALEQEGEAEAGAQEPHETGHGQTPRGSSKASNSRLPFPISDKAVLAPRRHEDADSDSTTSA